MCPIFRVAQVRKLRRVQRRTWCARWPRGRLDRELLSSDALKEVADLCVNCHQCRLECPAGVDIPKLMIETKAQYIAANGLQPSDWLLSRIDLVGRGAA